MSNHMHLYMAAVRGELRQLPISISVVERENVEILEQTLIIICPEETPLLLSSPSKQVLERNKPCWMKQTMLDK